MKDRKLATRYARALLGALADPREAEAAEAFLLVLGEAMDRSPELRDAVLNPAVPTPTRRRTLGSLAEKVGAPTHVVNFLHTIVDNGRVASLPAIAKVFQEQRAKAQGVVTAIVASAAPLPADQAERLRRTFEKVTGATVSMTCTVDASLLGGVVARIGSRIYDGSLRTQLEGLRRRMVEE